MAVPPDPSDEELVTFAESLLTNVPASLRERRVLEEAVQQHRNTWLKLYEAAADLKRAGTAGEPPEPA